jgi:hypothetical protein
MTKIKFFFDGIHNNIKKYHDYVIWIFRNIQCIFDRKNNGVYKKYWNKKSKIGILRI